MKTIFIALLFVTIVAVSACTSVPLYQTATKVPYEEISLRCVYTGGKYEKVINTKEEYQQILDQKLIDQQREEYRRINTRPDPTFFGCVDYVLPPIDFSQRTLLGNGWGGVGCKQKVEKQVLRDNEKKEYIFTINAATCGMCEMVLGSYEWVSVPKIPSDYTIKFNVEQERSESPKC